MLFLRVMIIFPKKYRLLKKKFVPQNALKNLAENFVIEKLNLRHRFYPKSNGSHAITYSLYDQSFLNFTSFISGCILDGFPKTYEQAKALYEEVDEDGEPSGSSDKTTIPELLVDLTATKEFLMQRMMNLPEEIVQVKTLMIIKYKKKLFK
jgi:hypothetical protein